jgi:hypothetical protein
MGRYFVLTGTATGEFTGTFTAFLSGSVCNPSTIVVAAKIDSREAEFPVALIARIPYYIDNLRFVNHRTVNREGEHNGVTKSHLDVLFAIKNWCEQKAIGKIFSSPTPAQKRSPLRDPRGPAPPAPVATPAPAPPTGAFLDLSSVGDWGDVDAAPTASAASAASAVSPTGAFLDLSSVGDWGDCGDVDDALTASAAPSASAAPADEISQLKYLLEIAKLRLRLAHLEAGH